MTDWTRSELTRRDVVQAGGTVVASMRKGGDRALIAWAKTEGRAVRIDRETVWGNPFIIGRHGDRAAVIGGYRALLDHSPALKANLGALRGKVLLCWCHPDPCHGDVLCQAVA